MINITRHITSLAAVLLLLSSQTSPSLAQSTTTTTPPSTSTGTPANNVLENIPKSIASSFIDLITTPSTSLSATLISQATSQKPITVLAFSDAAFASLDPAIFKQISSNQELASALLSYHIIPNGVVDLRSAFPRANISPASTPAFPIPNSIPVTADSFAVDTALAFRKEQLPDPIVRLTLFGRSQSVVFVAPSVEDSNATLTTPFYSPQEFVVKAGKLTAKIIDVKIASNGIVYILDKVLIPPTSLFTTLKEDLQITEYPTFASLASVSQTLSSLHDVTIFVPTNAGSRSFILTEGDLKDTLGRAATLQFHVIPGVYYVKDLLLNGTSAKGLDTYLPGARIRVASPGSGVTSGARTADVTLTRVVDATSTEKLKTITLETPDIPFDGGVIHIVNTFIRPIPAGSSASSLPNPLPFTQIYPPGFPPSRDPLYDSSNNTRPGPNPDDLENSTDMGKDFPTGAVVGGVLGGAVFLGLVVCLLLVIRRRRRIVKRQKERAAAAAAEEAEGQDFEWEESRNKPTPPTPTPMDAVSIASSRKWRFGRAGKGKRLPSLPPPSVTSLGSSAPGTPVSPANSDKALVAGPRKSMDASRKSSVDEIAGQQVRKSLQVPLKDVEEESEEDDEDDDDDEEEEDAFPMDKSSARAERDRIISFRRSQWSQNDPIPSPTPSNSSGAGGGSLEPRASMDKISDPVQAKKENVRNSWWSNTGVGSGSPIEPAVAEAQARREAERKSWWSGDEDVDIIEGPTTPGGRRKSVAGSLGAKSNSNKHKRTSSAGGIPLSPSTPPPRASTSSPKQRPLSTASSSIQIADPVQAKKENVRNSWWSNTGVGLGVSDPAVAEAQARREAERKSWWSGEEEGGEYPFPTVEEKRRSGVSQQEKRKSLLSQQEKRKSGVSQERRRSGAGITLPPSPPLPTTNSLAAGSPAEKPRKSWFSSSSKPEPTPAGPLKGPVAQFTITPPTIDRHQTPSTTTNNNRKSAVRFSTEVPPPTVAPIAAEPTEVDGTSALLLPASSDDKPVQDASSAPVDAAQDDEDDEDFEIPEIPKTVMDIVEKSRG
ncbi:hypothetical protein HDU97_004294 [Phlyctochytrium planicorne]|nr:hypothetical protein HDU97_004294 [Phlyctochytrium planicorne]